jgi:2,3-bisphosphoglycerate-independent phosphoglycerate mutase
VGHTGVYDAAVEAIGATDKAVGTVYEACQEAGYILLITADHGNAEQMINPETGAPHTAHTTNKVPFIMTGDPKVLRFVEDEKKDGEEEEEGALADVAPTVLDILGLPKPEGGSNSSSAIVPNFFADYCCRNEWTKFASEE